MWKKSKIAQRDWTRAKNIDWLLFEKEMFTLLSKLGISIPSDSATSFEYEHIRLLLHVHKEIDAE